jgi:hypothetical protein
MLEKETEQIINTLAERTIGRRESITLKDALAGEMPKAVKVYMRTEVIRWLKTDMEDAPRFGKVNRSAPGINQLTGAFLRSLADAYQFTRNEFLTLLDDAVHFVENYLCRPQWTLENFLFDNKDSLPAADLFFKLGYTVEYSYFGRLIQKLVRQWGWKEVRVEDFRALISKIDNQVVRQHSPQELGMLTKSIYDFLLLSDAPLTRAIPLDPILLFFEDKKMSELKDHIERVCGIRERSELTIKEVIGLIQDFHSEPGETEQKPVMEEQIAEPEPEEEVPAPPVKPPEEPREQTPEPETVEPPPVIEKAIQLAISSDESEETSDGSEEAGLPDLDDLISKRQRSRFIRKLFMEELNRNHTWKEAYQYLNRVYAVNNLEPFSEAVIRFTDIVQSRFANTET